MYGGRPLGKCFSCFFLFVLSKLTLKQMCDSTIVGTLSHRPLLKVVNSHLFKPMADQFRLLLALLFCFSLKRHNFVSPYEYVILLRPIENTLLILILFWCVRTHKTSFKESNSIQRFVLQLGIFLAL